MTKSPGSGLANPGPVARRSGTRRFCLTILRTGGHGHGTAGPRGAVGQMFGFGLHGHPPRDDLARAWCCT